MKNGLKLKEIVVIAMISVVIGVAFLGLDAIYQPLTALAGPVGGDILYGIYLLSALLPAFIVRKPGAALIGSLLTGIVNLLLGSPYGIHIIIAALLQGAGVELGLLVAKYKGYKLLNMGLGAVLAMLLVTARDYFIFGFAFYGSLVPVMLLVRVVSAIILGGLFTMGLGKALKATGVLNGFKISVEE